jgi:hypothetical protein
MIGQVNDIYFNLHVTAKDQDRAIIVKSLTSGDFQYTITLRTSNKAGGLRIDVDAKIAGTKTKMTNGICFSVMLCRCNLKQPQRHRPQAWPGCEEHEEKVNLDKCHIILAHQRRGHGTRIMTELIRWYRESKTTLLTVAAPHAGPFYTKLGFVFQRAHGIMQLSVDGSKVTSISSCSTLTLRGYNVILTCATGTQQRGRPHHNAFFEETTIGCERFAACFAKPIN